MSSELAPADSGSCVYGPRKVWQNLLHSDDEDFSKSVRLKIILRWKKLLRKMEFDYFTQTFVRCTKQILKAFYIFLRLQASTFFCEKK